MAKRAIPIFLLITAVLAAGYLFLIRPCLVPTAPEIKTAVIQTAPSISTPDQKVENIIEPEKAAAPAPEPQTRPVVIMAFGDLLLDRYIKREIDRHTPDHPFENFKETLAGHDLVLANLEGSFTDYKPRPLNPNNTSFTFDPKLVEMVKSHGFNIFNLANNHVQDFGKQGFVQSQKYLDQAGIGYFGDFYNEGKFLLREINGIKIAFIGYNEFGDAAIASTLTNIKEARLLADYVIVYTHWGAEYQNNFWPGSQVKGRRFVDAGADIILGSHPHVVQPVEIYKNKPIFYSLGNFVFDQIFSFEVSHGLGVKISLDKEKMEFELVPTAMKNFQVNLASEEDAAKTLANMAKYSVCRQEIKDQIMVGKFTIGK